MPHLTVEYSANLTRVVDPMALLRHLHDAAMATGVFPPLSLRTRASERSLYVVGDGHPDNMFVHIVVRVRPRDAEEKRRLAQIVFDAANQLLEPVFAHHPLGLTCEVHEIDVNARFLRNSMPDYWARQG